MDRYLRILAWTLDTSRMDKRRETLEAPASRARYTTTLLLTSIGLLIVTLLAMFEFHSGSLTSGILEGSGAQPLWNGLAGLGISENAALAVSDDGTGTLAFIVSKTFDLFIIFLVSLLTLAAGYVAFRALTPVFAALAYVLVWALGWVIHLLFGWALGTSTPRAFSVEQVGRGARWASTRFFDHRNLALGMVRAVRWQGETAFG